MQRLSVSIDDDLAAWIESQADQRGVSKAKIIRDSVETARVTGLVQGGGAEPPKSGHLVDRLENLETRVAALEEGTVGTADETVRQTGGVIAAFAAQLENRPPWTDHGERAVILVFSILLDDGPMRTGELRETLYPEFTNEFANASSMWQSVQRYFDEIPGIERVGHGVYDADPSQVV